MLFEDNLVFGEKVLGVHEEESITLEEEIKILQEEGLPPEKIVEKVLEEDLNADINVLASTLQLDKLVIGRIKGRLSRLKKRREQKEKPPEPAKEAPPEGVYKTEPDVNVILEEILKTHPDIPDKVKDEVMDWAKRRGSLDPGFVAWLLSSMRGISTTTANIVSQKYALAVQKAQQEGKIQLPMGYPMWPALPGQPQQAYPQVFPHQQQQVLQPPGQPTQPPAGPQFSPPTYGYGYPQAQQPQQDLRTIIREEFRLLYGEPKPKEPSSEQFIDIYEPVKNEEGQVIVNDKDQPIMKHFRVPVSQAGQFAPQEDQEARFLRKMKDYKDLFGSKEELTVEKIRAIIREEAPKSVETEKPITLEDVQRTASEAATSAARQVQEAHEKEDKEEKRHKEVIQAIQQSGSARAVEGYKDDSFRIVGQGLSEAAGAIKERKPVEVIIKEGGKILFGGPSEKAVEPGAGEGIIERLRKHGWVSEQ